MQKFIGNTLVFVNKNKVLLCANSSLVLFIDTDLNVCAQRIRFCRLDLQSKNCSWLLCLPDRENEACLANMETYLSPF